ncbi:MAG: polysaccharide biosynthesis protein [Clostridia bacterium]|nr:polysaccharide biosynthesis protein [Clostridia bacterium]
MEQQKQFKGQSMLNGALVLVVATMLVKVIGAIYKIPLTALIGEVGRGYFSSAYEIYTPIYAISMAGLPVAVSKMVSESVTLGNYNDARQIFKVAQKLFFIVGIVGTLLLVLIAFPYVILGDCKDNLWSILMIAPSIFFCCMMSTYRGYYEGLRNMTPTAVSQVIEALGKLILGLIFSKVIINIGLDMYNSGQPVFGVVCTTLSEADSAIAPYAAAGAVFAVTLGTVAALVFMIIHRKLKGDSFDRTMLVNSPRAQDKKATSKTMITIAVPMVISALITNVTNLIDNFTIRTRLAHAVSENLEFFKTTFAASLQGSGTLDKDIGTYLYGCYFSALDFKNLITSITMSLGVSAIPALAAAVAMKDKKEVGSTINSVIRICMLVAAPAGLGIAALSEPIMTLLYGGTNAENLIPISSPIVMIYGIATFILALSTPLTNVLQAMGRADIPAKTVAIGAAIKVVSNFIFVGIPELNIYGATIGTVLCYTFIIAANIYFTMKVSGCRIKFLSTIVKPMISATLCALSAFGTRILLANYLTFGDASSKLNGANVSTLIAVGVAVVVYAVCMLIIKGFAYDDIIMLPKGKKIAKALEKYNLIG